jgi:hypothetical protein
MESTTVAYQTPSSPNTLRPGNHVSCACWPGSNLRFGMSNKSAAATAHLLSSPLAETLFLEAQTDIPPAQIA